MPTPRLVSPVACLAVAALLAATAPAASDSPGAPRGITLDTLEGEKVPYFGGDLRQRLYPGLNHGFDAPLIVRTNMKPFGLRIFPRDAERRAGPLAVEYGITPQGEIVRW